MPRYDVPKAAPEPLRLVQLFVNTADLEHGREWLGGQAELDAWLAEHGLGPARLDEAQALREALRSLLRRNNGGPLDEVALALVNGVAPGVRLAADGTVHLEPADDSLGRIVALAFEAMLAGDWTRLKVCRSCSWSFYDYSKNRSAGWCSMQLCGNRQKTRAYRSRRAEHGA
jgi:predicted RNA-binding Zn ribbon-like protein